MGLARIARLLLPLLVLLGHPALAEEVLHGQGRMWRVERQGVRPSHLFGTMHSADPRVTTLPPDIDKAFMASKTVMLELRMADISLSAKAQLMVMTDGRTLDEVLDHDLYQEARLALQIYNVNSLIIDRLTPSGVIMLLTYPPYEMALMRSGYLPLDMDLERRALAARHAVLALETVDEQIAAFKTLPEVDDIVALRATLSHLDQSARLYEQMLQLYTAGEIAEIERLSNQGDLATLSPEVLAAFNKALLDDRNARMVERMIPYLQKGSVFVAVGAAHMIGEQGVLARLERAGWTVTKVY